MKFYEVPLNFESNSAVQVLLLKLYSNHKVKVWFSEEKNENGVVMIFQSWLFRLIYLKSLELTKSSHVSKRTI